MPKPSLRERAPVKPRLLSVNDTAVTLGLGVTSIYGLIARKEIAAIKVGDRNLIKVESIDKFIASRPAVEVKPPRKRRRRLG
jgi:excisionase family DNA binding protein